MASKTLTFRTQGQDDMVDITSDVAAFVESSGTKEGLVAVFVVGSTAAITTIEFEPGLQLDLPARESRPKRGCTGTKRLGTTTTAIRMCGRP